MSLSAPFPYFGGKRRAAPIIWHALGDPSGYVEPFAGSAAVLLARPPFKGRRTETLNDADGWLVNTWRAIQLDPDSVALHAYGPVTEIDYHARLAWLHSRRDDELVAWLEGDPENHDAKAAGWWLYVMACGIGDPFGGGPWVVIDGKLANSRTSATQARASTANSRTSATQARAVYGSTCASSANASSVFGSLADRGNGSRNLPSPAPDQGVTVRALSS